jgi:hypothetical protein
MGVIKQIRFYWNTGVFISNQDALNVCEDLRLMLMVIQKQAEKGRKFIETEHGTEEGAEFNLYFSEIEFENTCIHVEMDELSAVFLGQLSFRFLKTNNKAYCDTTKGWYKSMQRKSTLISGTSQTTRYQFFKRCFDKLSELEDHIKTN